MINRSFFAFAISILLAISGCENSSSSDDSPPSHPNLVITSRLRSICPTLPAARKFLSPTTGSTNIDTMDVTLYDSTGLFLDHSRSGVLSNAVGGVRITFNGKDSKGNSLPTGVYFFVLIIVDPANDTLRIDTTCMGWISH